MNFIYILYKFSSFFGFIQRKVMSKATSKAKDEIEILFLSIQLSLIYEFEHFKLGKISSNRLSEL